jgi:hypothetical protein
MAQNANGYALNSRLKMHFTDPSRAGDIEIGCGIYHYHSRSDFASLDYQSFVESICGFLENRFKCKSLE